MSAPKLFGRKHINCIREKVNAACDSGLHLEQAETLVRALLELVFDRKSVDFHGVPVRRDVLDCHNDEQRRHTRHLRLHNPWLGGRSDYVPDGYIVEKPLQLEYEDVRLLHRVEAADQREVLTKTV